MFTDPLKTSDLRVDKTSSLLKSLYISIRIDILVESTLVKCRGSLIAVTVALLYVYISMCMKKYNIWDDTQ